MYATKSLELTTKASEILRLINKANDRIDETEQKLFEYENATKGLFIVTRDNKRYESLRTKRANAYKAKERLVRYYGATVLRLIYNGLKQNVFEYLDKPKVKLNA